MSTEEEEGRVERLVKEGEREAQSLEKDAEKLGERIHETRREWEQHRRDREEPGASVTDDEEPAGESGGEPDDQEPAGESGVEPAAPAA
jgi:hypothetical protein